MIWRIDEFGQVSEGAEEIYWKYFARLDDRRFGCELWLVEYAGTVMLF